MITAAQVIRSKVLFPAMLGPVSKTMFSFDPPRPTSFGMKSCVSPPVKL